MAAVRCLDQLHWPEVEAAARQPGSTVLWPFGALEQHGPHLPLGTDALFAERVAAAVLARLDGTAPIWSLPCVRFGFSPEHQGFPGTLTLPAELLIAQVQTIGAQLAALGFQRLVLFNGHGGQIALLQVASRQLRAACPSMAVLPCFLWSGHDGLLDQLPQSERQGGLHAGLAETSLMLHLAPGLVGESRPVDGLTLEPPPGWSLEGALPCAWLTTDLSESGVVGDSRGSTADLGERLYQGLVAGWIERLEGLLASDWPPRGAGATG